jgi:hypothetical protein
MDADTMPFRTLTARCGGTCPHAERGPDPLDLATRMLGHWRAAHIDLIEAPFLAECVRPGCGRSCWGTYCCEACMASDDGGPPLDPWAPGGSVAAVHDRACEERARRRHPEWYAGSARARG